MFDKVVILCASKYTVHNQLLLVPEDDDKYNNEYRFFCKFTINLPQNLMINLVQEHVADDDGNHKQVFSESMPWI